MGGYYRQRDHFVSSSNSFVEILTPKQSVKRWAFGRGLDNEGRTLINEPLRTGAEDTQSPWRAPPPSTHPLIPRTV